MEQYERGGPPPMEKTKEDQELNRLIDNLKQQIESQDRRIKELERVLQRLKNDVRTAISAANTISSNHRRNG